MSPLVQLKQIGHAPKAKKKPKKKHVNPYAKKKRARKKRVKKARAKKARVKVRKKGR